MSWDLVQPEAHFSHDSFSATWWECLPVGRYSVSSLCCEIRMCFLPLCISSLILTTTAVFRCFWAEEVGCRPTSRAHHVTVAAGLTGTTPGTTSTNSLSIVLMITLVICMLSFEEMFQLLCGHHDSDKGNSSDLPETVPVCTQCKA